LVGGVVVAGLLVGSASATAPLATVVQAVQRTSSATSANLSLTERVSFGAVEVVVRLRGIQQPRASAGSFVFSLSPAQTGLGQGSEILEGSKVYVHYGLLDTLHAKNPAVKTWLLVDSRSNFGVDPSGLATLGVATVRKMTGVTAVGSGTEAGMRVTRYRGTLDLRQAAASPQMQALFSHLPSASATLLNGKEQVEISIGTDGYVHRVQATITSRASGGTSIHVTVDSEFTNFNQYTAALVPPPASDVMSLSRFNQLMGLPSQSARNLLSRVLLRASQVGFGYRLAQIPGGQLVQGEATLDYCGFTYPSESLRTARIQVVYTRKGTAFKASNEVVSYRPGGAQQALREARHAATACPQGAIKKPPTGVTSLSHHARFVTDAHLLPGAVAILDHVTATINGKRQTNYSMEVFQDRGNILSGVYGSGPTAAATQTATLHAAEQSAHNLEHSVAASPTR
jgi:hypothetical protein